MNILQFQKVSHINYGCMDMPECSVSLLARPGEKFKDASDTLFFARRIKATNYIYKIDRHDWGTADDVIKFYGRQLLYEFSEEQDRHVFRFRPWADVHFLDGSIQTIYFNNADEVAKFSQQMNMKLGLDKHFLTNMKSGLDKYFLMDGNNFVCVGEMRPFDDPEAVNK